jgi:hypothetical protein
MGKQFLFWKRVSTSMARIGERPGLSDGLRKTLQKFANDGT